MWRLPPRAEDCEAAKTRSLWVGLIPTYAADHWTDPAGHVQTKLDDHAIYQLRCIVTRPPERGHEQCPPETYMSAPTAPFRLAAAFDPDGTKNHTVSITTPDLRRLAARAGQRQGPGGLRITTPPKSALSSVDFKSIPGANLGKAGSSGQICSFAFELFFMVALFLFLLFLPIIVLAFQLWFLLALRFCIPPSASFKIVADFFTAGGLVAKLQINPLSTDVEKGASAALDELIGVHNAAAELFKPGPLKPPSEFSVDPNLIQDLVAAIDPKSAQTTPVPPPQLTTPPDPLCSTS